MGVGEIHSWVDAGLLPAAILSTQWLPRVNSTCLNLFRRREVIYPSAPFGPRGLWGKETQPCEKKRAVSSCTGSYALLPERVDENPHSSTEPSL